MKELSPEDTNEIYEELKGIIERFRDGQEYSNTKQEIGDLFTKWDNYVSEPEDRE